MLLYILRHAEAEAKITSDRDRRLTLHGREQAKSVGRFCSEHKIFPEIILTSSVVRAKQTAEEVFAVLKKGELIDAPWMACGMDPNVAFEELRAYKIFKSVMIVGHEPDLSCLIATLLGLKNAFSFEVKKGSLTLIEVKEFFFGAGILKWSLPPELLEVQK
ncbi:MAG: phosphohistidine phosphatase SixA [Chthoniobacterales bacterium]|nr:phosphohistidine phosphatase SixA [Chthoniobacterales bacterium]